ncbi:AT-rich interactive domain-containing protein 3B isoform X2 [Danio aesculapii]|uniref:AT-rich interactive domain-containing protein 3B isoform X2 n=1 Tax=Danio aesculapii TaxID=1142201 RepID=UPI0024C04FD7|nr:AT-rich interactive domain-containing protein 3B isoform X2 [Danio aesculapii]
MVDNNKTQMEGLSSGLKLEAMLEHLHQQQQERLHSEQQQRRLREAHFFYTQQLAAQQAILAAARASGAALINTHASLLSSSSVDSEHEDEEERGRDSAEDEDEDDESEEDELDFLRKQSLALQQRDTAVSGSRSVPGAPGATVRVKEEPEEEPSPADRPSETSPNGPADWSYEEPFKANGSVSWSDDADAARSRGEASRDFAKLYELDSDPQRKEFLDDLFTFMQKRGTPVNRIPIMAKQVLDLYRLYRLVTEKGGLVEVINKKIWREITKGLNLPTSITSAAFTLRTQYMKYLYPYECERKALSSPNELQAAIDSNRREGRRPSYSNTLFHISPSHGSTPHLLTPPTMQLSALSSLNGFQPTAAALKKRLDMSPSVFAGRSLPLTPQQAMCFARAATLEQLREKLETEAPERKLLRLSEEQQRVLQLSTHTNNNTNTAINTAAARDERQDLSLSISSSGSASISVSVEVNGILYSGNLFAQKSVSAAPVGPSGLFTFSSSAPSQSPASCSSKGRSSVEASTSGSP